MFCCSFSRVALFFALQTFHFKSRHRDPRTRAIHLFASPAQIAIERDGFLLAGLLQNAQPFQFLLQSLRVAMQLVLPGNLPGQGRFLLLQLRCELAHLALQHQRPTGLLAASGQHAAVVTLSIGEQEISLRMRFRQIARLLRIRRKIAARKLGQQSPHLTGEPVREVHQIGQAWQVERLRRVIRARFLRGGFHQEGRAAFQFRTQQVHAAFRLRPVFYDYVLQLLVQELFRRSFPCGIDFNEVGQHALRLELTGAAILQRGQQLLRRFRCIAVVRKHVLQRFALGP